MYPLNALKDICMEAKHVGAHLMGQLKKKCHLKADKNKSFWMFTEPDTIPLFCLLMYMYFLFYSITPLCPYYVFYNPVIFSVDGHHFAFFYMTEHNYYSVFCNQKQGSTKNVNANLSGNLYGATYFFPCSLRWLCI